MKTGIVTELVNLGRTANSIANDVKGRYVYASKDTDNSIVKLVLSFNCFIFVPFYNLQI